MSTLSLRTKDNPPNLDGENDLKPVVKTSYLIKQEETTVKAEAKAKAKAKKTTTTKE